jgi:D-alanine--poly(phosphoribitol) ligase subunit 2
MEEKLLDILVGLCEEESIREDLDVDLFEEEFLDSLAMVELLMAIEDTFGVTISPSEYDKTALSTVHKIEAVLKEKGVS